jgi:hypothetical protein
MHDSMIVIFDGRSGAKRGTPVMVVGYDPKGAE